MLGTQGWQKILDKEINTETPESQEPSESENPLNAITRLVEHFRIPFEGAAAEVSETGGEYEAMVKYATQFISFSTTEYQSVWWRLFHALSVQMR